MWGSYYDNASMVTHGMWGGWGYSDKGAVGNRKRLDRCHHDLAQAYARGESVSGALEWALTQIDGRALGGLRRGLRPCLRAPRHVGVGQGRRGAARSADGATRGDI